MKTWTFLFPVTLACLLAAGCATQAPPVPADPSLFHDSAFAAPTQPIGADKLFELSEPMRAYIGSKRFKREAQQRGKDGVLAHAMSSMGELKLNYDDIITRDAAGTFAAGSGNCLSLVIMSAAFAKALDLEVTYQSVRLPPDWSRGDGLYVASGHVNLSLSAPHMPNAMVVDFVPPDQASKYHTETLSETTLVAMYLNNRAAEEMGQLRIDNAYWWARAAIQKDPAFSAAYNTLGVIYQKRGELQRAETVYKRALARVPEDTVVMHNLVQVLALEGKTAEAAAVEKERMRLQPTPPFYYFERGMKAMQARQFVEAKQLFEREVKRAPQNHEFHYWLAMAHLALDQPAKAREHMAIAVDNSTSAESTKRYSSKLAYLRAAVPGRAQ